VVGHKAPLSQGYGLICIGGTFSEWDSILMGCVGPSVPCCYVTWQIPNMFGMLGLCVHIFQLKGIKCCERRQILIKSFEWA